MGDWWWKVKQDDVAKRIELDPTEKSVEPRKTAWRRKRGPNPKVGRSKLTGARATSDSSQREILEFLIPVSTGNPKGIHNSYFSQNSEMKFVNSAFDLTIDSCDQGIIYENKYRN